MYYNLSHMDECSMRFIEQDRLISPEAEGKGINELVKPDKSHITQNPCVINFISHTSGDMTFIRCVTCANVVLSLDRNSPLYDYHYITSIPHLSLSG